MTLRNPNVCRCGSSETKILVSREKTWYVWRRHQCFICWTRWTSYETLLNPHRIKVRPLECHQ